MSDEITKMVEELAKMAAAADSDHKRCIEGEVMLYRLFDRALVPGHIYSDAGMAEAKISGCCEYHFDRWFQPGWVDAVTGEAGRTPAEDD